MRQTTPLHRGGAGEPLVLLHGFTASWRTWELVLPALERRHDVLAPTLLGHAGGPPLPEDPTATSVVDAAERAMDEAGLETAHLVGNSLGGFVALALAARGRARTVVALAPAGGWAPGDPDYAEMLQYFATMHEQTVAAAPHADQLMATREGRRLATASITVQFEHLPAELLADQLRAAAQAAAPEMLATVAGGYPELDAAAITCPVRIVWGTDDQLLRWPTAAVRFREDWLPHADWVVLDGVGHCPQLDVPLETAQLVLGFTT
ncbi:alpha/beta fold hydrolase [Conexibacter sp. SYSU D00693]|uniref:alpha/beta fold hydrolase n=1 Tax=Conexibacter sp. SYSU D00693 TaxID=2812560 RepID=UPI00196A9A31|nr:alpha/beta hydrolase [Conexibacter sp. SYSU D00693]